jgi:uncharacterized protein
MTAAFDFCGQTLVAMPQGALFWPTRRALIVADLHFEKASWFARFGQMLPPYDSLATLTDLSDLIARTDARELWCLGDSFHDSAGAERLSADARAMLDRLSRRVDWVWVTGNHDHALNDRFGGRIVEEAEIDGLMLRHEANPNDRCAELSGHFHPKLRIVIRGRTVARRCFIRSETKLILPAFGALTGGLDATHPEIVRAVGHDAHAMIAVNDRLLTFPLAA